MIPMLMGIDIGTSACKVGVFNTDGVLVASATKPYKVYYPQSGWAEQNPNEWYAAICQATQEVCAKVGSENITAVGIDGQGWSAIPVDKSGNVLDNTPIWFDTRANEECAQMLDTIGFDKLFAVTGNPVTPSYSSPKIMWLKKHKPEIYAKADKFLQSNAYIAYKLTGNFSQDKSQGYGLFFYDMNSCTYNADMADKMGLDLEKFPEIVDCHAVVGTVTSTAADETGLKPGTPVVAGGLDAACGTLGVGVCRPGQTQEQGGQAGGMSICVDSAKAHPKLILSNHVVPDLWLLQGGSVGGGGTIKWFSEQFGKAFDDGSGKNLLKLIDESAAKISAGSDGVIFLPYMAGERSPIWDTKAKGVYFGLSYDKSIAHMARATMEGVAYSLLHNIETAAEAGVTIDCMYAMGGAANSRLWTQLKADVTNTTIYVPDSDNASTLGACILAGLGTGVYKSCADAVDKTVSVKREHIPNIDNHKKYQQYFPIYKELYEDLKDTYAKLNNINL